MVAAYFDESGIHDGSQFTVVAGYVAPATAWQRFNREWLHFLLEDNLSDLHMRTFPKHKLNEERLLGRACYIIGSCKLHAVVGVVDRKAFAEIVRGDATAFCKIGTPYALCTMIAMTRAAEWTHRNVGAVSIQYTFANLGNRVEGIKVKGELLDLTRQYLASSTQMHRH